VKGLLFAKIEFSAFVRNRHIFQVLTEISPIDRVPIPQEILWRSVPGKCLDDPAFLNPKNMFKSSLSVIFIMDEYFADLCEKVNNFKYLRHFIRAEFLTVTF